ncbi:MAG: hypothetical protein CSA35_07345 [Dethiosulfovibrio peptidovorans]|nr:MAG: hypothetical protein CSA35_07345 [Dethiosulfovibrio peptidovorans]
MRKSAIFLWGLLCVLMFGSTSLFGATDSQEKIVQDRLASLWVEGQVLGDMILGARGRITLIYMDRRACNAVREQGASLPSWVSWNNQYETRARRGGRGFFLVHYEAKKNWIFDPTEIIIGDYRLTEDDVLTRKDFQNVGDLASGTEATLAISVPKKSVLPGRTITISYGTFATEWTVPRR